ncbi:hypothetical protein [Halorubrum sp. LN27]|uniref:hypothetical protein n=1 Tax=Halorubrum sp. LN27 TaxID=2801032 RepID=UPI00190E24C9|nr:hypothetical protein [Halorubrum sp. LN27]
MAKIEYVLLVPPDYSGEIDPMVDRVEVDESVTRAGVKEVKVSDAGAGVLDRDLVSDTRKIHVLDAITEYEEEAAKDAPDVQIQLAALEKAISYIWDVVSGEDIGHEAIRQAEAKGEPEEEEPAE